MILLILFWILWTLSIIGCFVPAERYPNVLRGSTVVNLILIGILGYKIFGNPLDK